MVRATASQASTCGIPDITNPDEENSNCVKQEIMFDKSLSDFLVSTPGSSSSFEVCNPAPYCVGMWLQFYTPRVTLRIVSISGSIITVVNRCNLTDNAPDDNPEIGTIIERGAKFAVVGAPRCFDEEDATDDLVDALANLTGICVPELGVGGANATMWPVGRIEEDPDNVSQGPCIKRIPGVKFIGGVPYLSALDAPVNGVDAHLYRRLVKNTANDSVHVIKNYSEYSGMTPTDQYYLSVNSDEEKLVGPGYLFRPFNDFLAENSAGLDPAAWPVLDVDYDHTYNLSTIPQIDTLVSQYDHIWVNVRLELAGFSDENTNFITAELGGIHAGRVNAFKDADCNVVAFNSITLPIKVMKSDYNLALSISSQAACNFYFRIAISGIWF